MKHVVDLNEERASRRAPYQALCGKSVSHRAVKGRSNTKYLSACSTCLEEALHEYDTLWGRYDVLRKYVLRGGE